MMFDVAEKAMAAAKVTPREVQRPPQPMPWVLAVTHMVPTQAKYLPSRGIPVRMLQGLPPLHSMHRAAANSAAPQRCWCLRLLRAA